MNEKLPEILAELEAQGKAHDAQEADHGRRMLNLEPDTAQLLSILVRSGHKIRLLEIGTSNGYSTLWLADAAQSNGGHVTSVDQSAEKQAMADANLTRAGLRSVVTLRLGEAQDVAASLEGTYDFVFLDADRRQYPALLRLLAPRLAPGALVLADNVHSHPQEIAEYLEAIAAHPDFDHVVAGVGKGLSIAFRRSVTPVRE